MAPYFMEVGLKKYVSKKECLVNKVLDELRKGKSLYASCLSVGLKTSEFYDFIAKNEKAKEMYLLALTDYADKCVDDIRNIVDELKNGEIDNSTAKLLIETLKWLVSKSNQDVNEVGNDESVENDENLREIVVKFV